MGRTVVALNSADADLPATRTPHSRSGTSALADSTPTPSPLQAEAHSSANTGTSPTIDKSLHGFSQLPHSNPQSSNEVPQDVSERERRSLASVLSGLWRSLNFRGNATRRHITTGPAVAPADSGSPPPDTSTRVDSTYRRDHQHRGAVSQGRAPRQKAFLVTANGAPRIDGRDSAEPLDSTMNDATRLRRCLQTLGFQADHIHAVQGIDDESVTEKSFMDGLDIWLSDAQDGDVLVLLVSMHAILDRGEVFLVFKRDGNSPVRIGNHQLVEKINSKLGNVRCTVEVILDICYAAGLLKCQHIIGEMGAPSSTVVASQLIETYTSPTVSQPPISLTEQYSETIGATYKDRYATLPIMTTTNHRSHAVAAGAPIPVSPSMVAAAASRLPSARNGVFMSKGAPLVKSLQTPSIIIVWAAAKENQTAHECCASGDSSGGGGALTTAICEVVEEFGKLSREAIFKYGVIPLLTRLNEAPEEPVADKSSGSLVQQAQISSNHNDAARIMQGRIFQSCLDLPG